MGFADERLLRYCAIEYDVVSECRYRNLEQNRKKLTPNNRNYETKLATDIILKILEYFRMDGMNSVAHIVFFFQHFKQLLRPRNFMRYKRESLCNSFHFAFILTNIALH